jgi:hypothetical protein
MHDTHHPGKGRNVPHDLEGTQARQRMCMHMYILSMAIRYMCMYVPYIPPVLIAPQNGAVLDTLIPLFQWDTSAHLRKQSRAWHSARIPILVWNAVAGTVEYAISLHDVDRDYWYGMNTSLTEVTLSWPALDPNTHYDWYVTARNDYAWGTDPSTWQFTTTSGP